MLCFRVTTLFAVSNDHSLSSQQTPLCRNKVPDNGRIPVKLTVLTEFSPQLTEDGHPNVLLSRTLRQFSEKTVVQPALHHIF